jgi:nucleoside-diphosphate-sugar epimerase
MRVAILGAGTVGLTVARLLIARGDQVLAVRRTPQPPEPHLTWLTADLQHLMPSDVPGPLDAVVLCVAPSGSDTYGSTYPPAVRTALALAAKHLVYTSSTGVYGGREGESMTETSPRRGGPPELLEAEDLLLTSQHSGITVLRVAGLYGPGRDPRGRYRDAARLPNGGEHWVNLVHHHDVASAILQVLPWTGAPRVLNLSDGSPTLAREVCRHLAQVEGRDPKSLTFPPTAPSARSNQRIDTTALRSTGWSPRYPSFREGFAHGLS